jgi:hypothetical protein
MRVRLRAFVLNLRERLAIAWMFGRRRPADRDEAREFLEDAMKEKVEEAVEKYEEESK